MKPYLYLNGLKELANEIDGNETIHVGIRPYGFHAGNVMALVAYPYLLCKFLENAGKEPRLRFFVSINDWEQDALDGPDYRRYPFNIYPKNTSLQFTGDKDGCCESIADHWQPIIEKNLIKLRKRFPKVNFRFVRNSELISHPYCKKLLLETIKNPHDQLKILKNHSAKETLDAPVSFAGVICPKCHKAHGKTSVSKENIITWQCSNCDEKREGVFESFQYWWYHKPMLIARIKIFDIGITLSGGDHFSEGDFKIREEFIKKYSPDTKEPKMVFTPTVIALNGEKMSKSRDNTAFADVKKLIQVASGFNEKDFNITEDLILDKIDEKDYSSVF